VFYSRSFSHELFEQAKARLDRAGQTRPVTNYILHATDTVDRAIHAVLNGKRSVAEAVYAMIRGDATDDGQN
jgi:SNF2 family DNA or RNA helicase